ncbi:hypothetical protein [Rhodobacteraceae bacterium DSL-40]
MKLIVNTPANSQPNPQRQAPPEQYGGGKLKNGHEQERQEPPANED